MNNLSFTIGKDLKTNHLVYASLIPNLLILGGTASSKTAITNHIIQELTSNYSPDELQLILVGTNAVSFSPFHDLPHLIKPIINDSKSFPDVLKYLKKLVDERRDILIKSKCNSAKKYNAKHPNEMPPIVMIIDEITDVLSLNDKIESELIRFFQAYQRATSVYIILNATTSKNLSSLMIANLGMNKILLQPSKEDNYKVFPELKDQLEFTDPNGRIGYYFNAFSKNQLQKFTLEDIEPSK